jgi:isopentenyl diphosphate isomerase/L-lactate dehydrogenase-like FMN-dependent dehydrogenase
MGPPSGAGGAGTAPPAAANIRALEGIKLKSSLIGPDFTPDTRFDFFNRRLAMPVMGASVAGVDSFGGEAIISEIEFCRFQFSLIVTQGLSLKVTHPRSNQ